MSALVERVRFGGHGQGSLAKFSDGPNWYSVFGTRGLERNIRRGFFERADFEQVLTHLPEHLRDAAAFGYLCGWRRSEIAGLRWEWVQADRADDGTIAGGTIILPDSKNGRGRCSR